jgi:hypothetical protein
LPAGVLFAFISACFCLFLAFWNKQKENNE